MPTRVPLTLALLVVFAWLPVGARALPIFSHRYGVTCQKCHTQIPHLTSFGTYFLVNGYRMPGIAPGPAVPLAVKVNLVDSSAYQGEGPGGAGLPKAIVDEIELLSAGPIGSRASYFLEQYVVDGGQPGLLRDAWVSERLVPWDARTGFSIEGGQFTLPLPVDPETFRETYEPYAVYDQRVGNNPFDFFDPKVGGKVMLGNVMRGASVEVFAGPGHDRQSGLPTVGTDVMEYAQQVLGPVTLSAYHYQGVRPDGPSLLDGFWRTGYGLVAFSGKWTSESVLQTGWDSSCTRNAGCASSGGFTQLRYAFGPRLFALARYEGTNDPTGGFARDGVVLLGYRPTHNSRLTIEDVIAHLPQTSNTMNLQLTVAY